MSDDDDRNEEQSNQEQLAKARVADTPNEDPRGETTERAQAEAVENDTDE